MVSKLFLFIAMIALTGGCAGTKNVPVTSEATRDLSGQSITIVHRELPSFTLMTATKAAFGGLVGGVSAVVEGNAVVRMNNIQDPAYRIADESVDFLEQHYGVVRVPHDGRIVDGESIEDISNMYQDVDYVLDVATVFWHVIYQPLDWNNYIVRYRARLMVIDTEKKASVAFGYCKRETDKERAPSYDELLNNDAEGLKKELENLSGQCIKQFLTETLVAQAGG